MKVTHRGAVAVLMAVVWVLTSASMAQAIIQVQRGISGVTLNMTKPQVKAALGRPDTVKRGTNPFGAFTQYRYKGGITVTFQGNTEVSAVSVSGQTDRTASGVGVGSTETEVKHGVPHVKCQTTGGTRSCHVGSFKAGHRVTEFLLRHGHVSRVTVGLVID
ncbi:MAG: hypothetical protein ACJ764_09295 [Solirubrobacteraceae bacterium]